MKSTEVEPREHYRLAAHAFAAVTQDLQPNDWVKPALGVWTVRDLTGHASRALTTVQTYLDPSRTTNHPDLPDAAAYFRTARAVLADPAAVADRGRRAGAALGADPVTAVAGLAERVVALVERSEDNALVTTPVGTMTLIEYLPSRTFELSVHTLDLAAAAGLTPPAGLAGPIVGSLMLAVELAATDAHAAEVLLALTGRRPMPPGFSVV